MFFEKWSDWNTLVCMHITPKTTMAANLLVSCYIGVVRHWVWDSCPGEAKWHSWLLMSSWVCVVTRQWCTWPVVGFKLCVKQFIQCVLCGLNVITDVHIQPNPVQICMKRGHSLRSTCAPWLGGILYRDLSCQSGRHCLNCGGECCWADKGFLDGESQGP